MSDPFTWSPISLGRWFGTNVRIHFLLIIFVAFELFMAALRQSHDHAFLATACWLSLLLATLMLHELGHAWTAWWLGSEQDTVRIWPLGNLVGPVYSSRPSEQMIVGMAGPATSGAFFLAASFALHFIWGAHLVWNPLGNTGDAGAPILAGGAVAPRLGIIWVVGWFGYLNYILMLVNLIPALPFDGGRMFRAYLAGTSIDTERDQLYAPATAKSCAAILFLVGLVRIFSGEDNGFTLIALALFIILYVRAEARFLDDGGILEEGIFGYDFSQGYTSLENSTAKVRPQPKRESALTRWRRRRSLARIQRAHDREIADEQRTDELLDKIHREGRASLSKEEQRFLVRVSARYRSRK